MSTEHSPMKTASILAVALLMAGCAGERPRDDGAAKALDLERARQEGYRQGY
jgi:hypothetical protein